MTILEAKIGGRPSAQYTNLQSRPLRLSVFFQSRLVLARVYIQKEEQEEGNFDLSGLTFTLRILAQWEEYHSVELVVAALGGVGVETLVDGHYGLAYTTTQWFQLINFLYVLPLFVQAPSQRSSTT